LTDQIIYDRGYRSYDGIRKGPAGARRAVSREGVRRLLGLGRKAKAKIFPWSLIAVALIVPLVYVAIAWAIGDLAEAIGGVVPTYGELFDQYSQIALIFIAFAGPTLLIPDRTRGVLSVYFSRPLTVDGYLAGKFAAYAAIVGAIYIVPQTILHLGLGLIAPDGFVDYMIDNAEILWKVPVITLGFVLLHGGLIFALSAMIKRTGIAAVSFLGVLTAGSAIAAIASQTEFPGSRWLSLLDLGQHPRIIRDELFRPTIDYPAQVAGFTTWASIVAILVVFLVSAWFVRYRYRKLA
jgi:ABC-2 type transport system permease protein